MIGFLLLALVLFQLHVRSTRARRRAAQDHLIQCPQDPQQLLLEPGGLFAASAFFVWASVAGAGLASALAGAGLASALTGAGLASALVALAVEGAEAGAFNAANVLQL